MISNEEYLSVQHQVQNLSALIKGVDLAGFLERVYHAETVGPLLNPTLYREASDSGKLDVLRETARALREAQRRIEKVEEEYREKHRG